MTVAGWLFLGLAWSVVLGLACYCIARVWRDD